MKRRITWWLAAALLGVGTITAAWMASRAGQADVQLRFLHLTNSTDRLSSDELEVFQKAPYLAPRLPPPTHAVLQFTNGSGVEIAFVAISVSGVPSESEGGKRITSDSIFPGKLLAPGLVAPGKSLSLELKVISTTAPWHADARFVRFGRAQRVIRRVIPYLPVNLRNWVGRKFLSVESIKLEFEDGPNHLRKHEPI